MDPAGLRDYLTVGTRIVCEQLAVLRRRSRRDDIQHERRAGPRPVAWRQDPERCFRLTHARPPQRGASGFNRSWERRAPSSPAPRSRRREHLFEEDERPYGPRAHAMRTRSRTPSRNSTEPAGTSCPLLVRSIMSLAVQSSRATWLRSNSTKQSAVPSIWSISRSRIRRPLERHVPGSIRSGLRVRTRGDGDGARSGCLLAGEV